MTRSALDVLPDHARLWVLVLDRPLESGTRAPFEVGMAEVVACWRHKGTAYDGAWELRDGQLLLVAEPTMAAAPSGCAIDGLMRRVLRLVGEAGGSLVGDEAVVARSGRQWEALDRAELEGLLASGRLTAVTPVLDRTLFSLGDLRGRGLAQPLAETWIGRKFGLGVAG